MSTLLTWRGHSWIALPMRLYLGAVFIFASLHKIAHPGTFALDVATYDLLPLLLINPMAIVLPYIEIVAGALLIIGLRTRAAALLVSAMMLVFLIAVGWAIHKGIDASCGCFASQAMADDPIGWQTVLRDLAWFVMALYVLLFDHRPIGLDRWLFAARKDGRP